MTAPPQGGPRRIGWLGGSFDPVHAGHLHVAREARAALDLERVLLVPAAVPPHKQGLTLAPGEDRLALLRVACAGDPDLVPCDLELHREGPSWSCDTADELIADLGEGVQLFAVIGADTLADLHTWRRLDDLVRQVVFCPVTRPGTSLDTDHLLEVIGAEAVAAIQAHTLHIPPHPASSTAVRQELRAGGPVEHLDPEVLDEIRRRGLYSSQDGGASSSSGS